MKRDHVLMLLFTSFILVVAIYVHTRRGDITHISGDKNSKEIIDSLTRINRGKDSVIGLYRDSLKSSRDRDRELAQKNEEIKRYYDKKYRSITIAPLRVKDSILRASVPGL